MIELKPGYYLKNFETLLSSVVERYWDLLSADEKNRCKRFNQLSLDAKRLFVRLLLRVGPIFRQDKIHYEEIPCLGDAISELCTQGFVDKANECEVHELLELMKVDELKTFFSSIEIEDNVPKRKSEMLELLDEYDLDDFREDVENQLKPIRRLCDDWSELLQLLFFGNASQDLTEFILEEVGVIRYEQVTLEKETRLFDSRLEIDERIWLKKWNEAFYLAELEKDVSQLDELSLEIESVTPFSKKNENRYFKALNRAARHLERSEAYEQALTLYLRTPLPPSRERQVRIAEKQDQPKKLKSILDEILNHSTDESEISFAKRFQQRISKKYGFSAPPFKPFQPETMTLKIDLSKDTPIEYSVLGELFKKGFSGFYSENHLWTSLLGLSFWDILFLPLKGAFQHPYQIAPLDLYDEDFYEKRKLRIEDRLFEVESGKFGKNEFLNRFEIKEGIANVWVSWHEDAREEISLALDHLPPLGLANVFKRMLKNPKHYCKGFPDLFLLDPENNLCFAEVKGPNDRLATHQRSWLEKLTQEGISAKLLWVKAR